MGVKRSSVNKNGDTMRGNLAVRVNGTGGQVSAENSADSNRGFVAKTATGKAQMGSNSNIYGVDLIVGGVVAQTIDTAFNQTRALGGGVSTQYPDYACRAWVNFNGVGTVAIRGSGNVSSITDNGVGNYTVNFTTAMPDANYSAVVQQGRGTISSTNLLAIAPAIDNPTTTQLRIGTYDSAFSSADSGYVNVAIFR